MWDALKVCLRMLRRGLTSAHGRARLCVDSWNVGMEVAPIPGVCNDSPTESIRPENGRCYGMTAPMAHPGRRSTPPGVAGYGAGSEARG
jgi:hypothetical protein